MLEQHSALNKVFREIEMPLVPVLARIERQGALVDANLLGLQSNELGEKLVALERQAFEIAGEEFNLASPKQLGVILYEKLGLPVISKTAKGQASTAEAVLAELAELVRGVPGRESPDEITLFKSVGAALEDLAGAILTFVPCLGAMIAPELLGGGTRMMLGNLIFRQFSDARNWPLGAALSLVLMAAVMLVATSGMLVPAATMVKPMIRSLTPMALAKFTDACTRYSEPNTSAARPAAISSN